MANTFSRKVLLIRDNALCDYLVNEAMFTNDIVRYKPTTI